MRDFGQQSSKELACQLLPIGRMQPHTIGKLCVGGDWACAHGDLAALRDVATRLETAAAPVLRSRLRALERACWDDPELAAVLWQHVRGLLRRSVL